LALAAGLGCRAVDDLCNLLSSGHNVSGVTNALASIADLTPDSDLCFMVRNTKSLIFRTQMVVNVFIR
jgi:hypothetical protein